MLGRALTAGLMRVNGDVVAHARWRLGQRERAVLRAFSPARSRNRGGSGAMQRTHDSAVMPAMDGSVGAAAEMHSHSSPAMLLAHCIAGIITIAMIYWAERLPIMLGDFAR